MVKRSRQLLFLILLSCMASCSYTIEDYDKLGASPPKIIYLKTSGTIDTAQKAVDAALALNPTALNPVIIDVGIGTFGDVILPRSFGTHVTWRGAGSMVSEIGNFYAEGQDPADAVDDGSGDPIRGEDATNGLHVTINAEASLTFGDIYANGGSGADSVNGGLPGNGGSGGTVSITGEANVGNIYSNGGMSGADAVNQSCGASGTGGKITTTIGTNTVSLMANGGGSCSELSALEPAGDGGTIIVGGTSQIVIANGGIGFAAEGGIGGTVDVSGTVTEVYSNGGDTLSISSSGGAGGTINILQGAVVTNNVYANGGETDSTFSPGGLGGTINVLEGATTNDVYVIGGIGDSQGGDAGTVSIAGISAVVYAYGGTGTFQGGNGGNVTVSGTVSQVDAYGANNPSFAGSGGLVIVTTSGAVIGNISAAGGDGLLGNGGEVQVSGLAGDVTVNGGINSGTGGNAGVITINSGGSVGELTASGGNSTGADGGNAGFIVINSGASAGNLIAVGGDSTLANGGNGGIIIFRITGTTTGTKNVDGGIGAALNGAPGVATSIP